MRIAVLALTSLTACMPRGDDGARYLLPDGDCGAEKLQMFIGLPYDGRDFEGREQPLRILPPGSAMTMDHNPARLNVNLDEGGTVTRIWCG